MSRISSLSIRRPVFASVMSIVIVIFGIIGYNELGVREYPVVDPPIITVTTSYTGASSDVVEREITEPLEDQINAVSGIRTLTSVSMEGRGEIRIEFDINIDIEVAANDVRDRVSRALGDLPDDANPPSVRKEDVDSDPILLVNLSSDIRDRMELTQYARNVLRDQLRTVDGVSIVSVYGQQRYTIRLWMDPDKMAAYDITPADIRSAIDSDNIELPSGVIEGDDTELTIRTMGRMTEIEEFDNLIIREEDGNIIRFQDIGRTEMGTRDDRTVLKRNGEPMLALAVIPQPGSNQIATVDEVFRRIDLISQDLPEDIKIEVGFDSTEYVRESITEVQKTLIFAFFLVVIIIFLFLRDTRTTIIPVIVVPITLVGCFFVMYMSGFTINTLTMLAMILAIGLVVDDAIIVLENIYAKMEEGLSATEAGILGTREIFFAIVATSMALISVFTPILFMEGVTGSLFREFGVVMIGAVLISSFVALTLTPMLSTKFLKLESTSSKFYDKTEPFFQGMIDWYRKTLTRFMKNRHYAFWILGATGVLIVGLFMILSEEVAPLEDRSMISVSATAPEGSTFFYTDRVMDQVIGLLMDQAPEIEVLNTITARRASNVADGFISLSDPGKRDRTQEQIAAELGAELSSVPGASVYLSQPQTLQTGATGLPVQFVIQAADLDQLEEVIDPFLNEVRNDPIFTFADVNLKFNRPEMLVEIDRNRTRTLGVSIREIAQTLQLSYAGSRYGYFTMDGRQYWVQGLIEDEMRREPSDLLNLRVRSNNGELVRMDNLVELVESSGPPELYRFNRHSSATVSAALAEGRTIGDGITAMRSIAERVLDERFSTDLSGTSRDFEESVDSLNFIFIMALIFIYLVLAAQFESFRDPFIILLTVPLALFGALLALWYFGETLNIFSKIAMIMLIGLVTKNGILIVEFANQRQYQGLSLMDSILDASVARFRPILMTSCSTLLGIMPLVFAFGAGAESRFSMGVSVIGGLVVGTFLSLFVVPAIYSYLATEKTVSEAELFLGEESNPPK
ncbi:MAG: efflux RND transporter permease subunit [Balneolaceae bacterium]|nr:efflux RND transporter permease subunit [Balneolaceae bacterium]